MAKELPALVSPRENMPALQNASAQAIVQRTLAEVQVAVLMAKQFPRDKIIAIEKLVNDCCREKLAEEATFSYSRGGQEITGPTIRLAEAAKNAWGNMQSGWRELSRHNGVSEIEAYAWDSENNTRESVVFNVKHWRDTKKGGYAVTDERDISEICGNQAKRRERTCILNLIDGDVIEAALDQVEKTLNETTEITPKLIESMLTNFEKFGVTKAQIEKRIQRRIDTINGPLMISLKRIYTSLKDGMSNASDWFDPLEAVVAEEKSKDKETTPAPETKEEPKKTAKPKEEEAKSAATAPEEKQPAADPKPEPSTEFNFGE